MTANNILPYLNSLQNNSFNITSLLENIVCHSFAEIAVFFLSSLEKKIKKSLACSKPNLTFIMRENELKLSEKSEKIKIKSSEIIKINKNSFLVLINTSKNLEKLLENSRPWLMLLKIATSKIFQRDSFRDLFMANLSHEIRTPLNGVIGYNQLLMNTVLNTTQKSYLASMRNCSIQLMQIINDVLDFFKLSSGKTKQYTLAFRPNEIISTVSDTLSQSLNAKKQTLSTSINGNVPEFVIGDKQKIIQIVMNILSNANKFSSINSTIKINLSYIDNNLQICVQDSGIGISVFNQELIFNAFEQVENSTNNTGTGLGLTISQRLAEFLGGQIILSSKLGKGSTFKIIIPVETKIKKDIAYKHKIKLIENKSILVVDDNVTNRILLSSLLFKWETRPIICASGLEALNIIQAQKSNGSKRYSFHLGLIDICMQDMDGIELARYLKQELPLIPLIALSSVDSFILNKDFVAKLDKPIEERLLLDLLSNYINIKHAPSAFIGAEKPQNLNSVIYNNKNQRILIAEDVLCNNILLVSMLNSIGYNNIFNC